MRLVGHMRSGKDQMKYLDLSASAYESTLRISPSHTGALVNGVHVLGQMLGRGEALTFKSGRAP